MDVTTHPQDMAAVLHNLADAWDQENAENADWAATFTDRVNAAQARGRTKQGRRYAAQLRDLIAQLEHK
jgi:hypothetical protein